MKSKISFCKKELIKNNLRMYGLLSVLWGIFLFMVYPLRIMTKYSYETQFYAENVFRILYSWVIIIPLMVSAILAIILFHFLKTDNGVAFHMSLPANKTQIFFSQFISGLLIYVVPLIINTGVIVLASAMRVNEDRGMLPIGILQWFLIMVLLFLVNFSISAGIGMVTGSVIWQLIFVIIFYFLPTYFESAGIFFGQQLLKGYDNINPLHDFFDTIDIGRLFLIKVVSYDDVDYWQVILSALIYAVIAFSLALLLYRLKKMESNREWVAFRFVKIFFIVGFTLCSVILMSTFFGYVIFSEEKSTVYMGAFIGAILGYIISAMIAWKTIYLKKAWIGVLVSVVVTVFILGVIDMDIFGYERYIPKAEEISQITINGVENRTGNQMLKNMIRPDNDKGGNYYYGLTLQTPESIELVRLIHQEAINSEKERDGYYYVRISYLLKNGKKVSRSYSGFEMNEENSAKLYLTEEALKQIYEPLDEERMKHLLSIKVQSENGQTEERFTGEKMRELLAVVRQEILDTAMLQKESGVLQQKNKKILPQKEVAIMITLEMDEENGVKQSDRGKAYAVPERMRTGETLSYVFYGEAPKLRQWLKTESSLSNLTLELSQIEEMVFYLDEAGAIGRYGLMFWRTYYHDHDYLGTPIAVEKNQAAIAKYLENSGRLVDGNNIKDLVLIDVHLKNGIRFYRMMTKEEYSKISK